MKWRNRIKFNLVTCFRFIERILIFLFCNLMTWMIVNGRLCKWIENLLFFVSLQTNCNINHSRIFKLFIINTLECSTLTHNNVAHSTINWCDNLKLWDVVNEIDSGYFVLRYRMSQTKPVYFSHFSYRIFYCETSM